MTNVKKKCKVVMLPTTYKAPDHISHYYNHAKQLNIININGYWSHLYITSDGEITEWSNTWIEDNL